MGRVQEDRKTESLETQAPKVFISYSRRDIGFVDQLQAALDDHGIDTLVDREDIEKGEAWWLRIEQLIAESDTVIFVLSRDSANSSICQQEVDFAETLNKRIVPIVARDLG
ncbi:toll/interleukin-1 receptor domain-containing protein, partial [Mesorhizobium sp.]|uniref:toll/interleukin-1 receptor domain-containing protein n=1 Tax=Mesorhizobium sp. TaxID=1871066 RepID=UPI000FE7674D